VAWDAAQEGKNIFITGSGGNGKSYITKSLTDEDTLVVAPTGIAAINVEGMTAHRAFGLPFGIPDNSDWYRVGDKIRDVIGNCSKLIISEIGMLRSDYLQLVDRKMRLVHDKKKTFGGVQVIVEGDFYQLEPIVGYRERELFYEKYKSPFCFSVGSWDFETHELTHPQRHEDKEQYELLNRIRIGDRSSLIDLLAITREYELSPDTFHMCCYNKDSERINTYWMDKVESPVKRFYANIQGKMSEKDVIVPEILEIKVGCRVMCCANDVSAGYVNGSKGVVVDINTRGIYVELGNGNTVLVEQYTWESIEVTGSYSGGLSKNVVGSFTQYPLILGYSVSVHKSQGLTLESAAINSGKGFFSHGQFYTAISRVKDLRNMSFLRKHNITENDVIVSQDVLNFYSK
jgi:hypothetical protein